MRWASTYLIGNGRFLGLARRARRVRRVRRVCRGRIAALLSLAAVAGVALASPVASQASGDKDSLPRYVSLKPSKVNLRSGPGTEYPTVWIYRREGLPLEVIKAFEGWRQVRDAEGASGWVLQSFLSARRTALVSPWDVKPGVAPPQVALYGDSSERATVIAKVEAGVIANIMSCDATWCWVTIEQFKGYIQQKKLWGVYEAEIIR